MHTLGIGRPEGHVEREEERRQRLRFQRFLLASAFSLLYLAVLALFRQQGKLDDETLLRACVVVVAAILAFFALFRTGANSRFRDPSLTSLQLVSAVATMLYVVYQAPDTRVVFGAFFFVALMFGLLRAGALELTLVGGLALLAFGLVCGLRYARVHDAEVLRLDLLQLLATAVAFPWLVFIGSRVRRLRDADRRKDEFLATLAHELRNPLAPIATGIDILKITGGGARSGQVLPMMERQLTQLTRLLDDLLDVSRIGRGKISLRLESVDLRDAVRAGVEASRPMVEQKAHQLTVSLPSEPVELEGDAVRLAQIVSNLLNNAARYTPAGGRIALVVQRRGGEAELCVEDNGVGIAARRLDSVFDMFSQLDTVDTPTPAGLGIGLSLVKALVTLHGGRVEARSDGVGRGSRFLVWLPLAAAPVRPARAAPVKPVLRARRKVLVIDDNHDAAASLEALLALHDHDVRIAYDGATGLELAEAFRPDLVLLDLGMPGLDGYEVCRRLRERRWGRDIRIVAVTGWGQEAHRRRSAAAGFDLHMVKPVSAEALARLWELFPAASP